MKRFFITGTDTDCGKTYVTTQLLNYFSSAAAIKPIASGCMEIENKLVNSDAEHLQKNSKKSISMEVINPWRFKLPVSPHIAAESEGVCLSLTEIADYCLNLQLDGIETLFIEGAGGLMVPLNDHDTWIDFLQITKIPVILVVGMKLGCINHALLTEAALLANNIQCTGWIANCIDPNMQALSANIATLNRKLTSPLLAKVPFGGDLTMIDFL
ncbi:Dethiobiotin synthetase [Legionella steigerwaltii]|uniref:ATP-dependent dethiobiotin synthetase BioD n=1 Tax=Legionella steigerwaltii TaxID=460 RepID=A0A378L8C9_9GAMM|nr:dethiobiotin synthase [Legionella steigerwaltii]KTD77664.1 Dethiobiotin synthetase [Legionella steigerwaltii]STY22974.1 Dethiobiotin synthetase [Legionella steigerwaltii]